MVSFKLSAESKDLIARFLRAEDIAGQLHTLHQGASQDLMESEKAALLTHINKGGGEGPIEAGTDATREKAGRVTALQAKIDAVQPLKRELQEKISAQLDLDRQAARAERIKDGQSLLETQGELQRDFIQALANAKILEIKLRRFDKRWNNLPPEIAPNEQDLEERFISEVQRLCKEEGIDSSYASPGDRIKVNLLKIAELGRPLTHQDINDALGMARREAAQPRPTDKEPDIAGAQADKKPDIAEARAQTAT